MSRLSPFAFRLLLGIAAVGAAWAGHAHEISPSPVVIKGVGNTAVVSVVDCCGCSANMTATSSRPDLFTVSPNAGTGTSVEFTLTAVSYGMGVPVGVLVITVQGIGSNSEDEPCLEDSVNPVTVLVTQPETSSGNEDDVAVASDPVNTFGGEFYYEPNSDLDLGGPLALTFSRRYSTHLFRETGLAGTLGPNWRHNFDVRLRNRGSVVDITMADGRLVEFEPTGQTFTLINNTAVPFQLLPDGFEHVLLDLRSDLVYRFDFAGNLSAIRDQNGNTLSVTNVSNRPTQVSDGLGRVLTFSYDINNLLASVGDGQRTITFGYVAGNLSTYTDAAGGVTTYFYDTLKLDAGPLMTSYRLPLQNIPFTQTFNSEGRVSTQTDAFGRTYTFDYDPGVTTILDPLGQQRVHEYDGEGRLSSATDEDGGVVDVDYDAQGRRAGAVGTDASTVVRANDVDDGNPTSLTLQDGTNVVVAYVNRGLDGFTYSDISSITYPDATTQTFLYDVFGNMTSMTDRDANVFTSTHNARGQVVTYTNPLGGVTTYAYNADGTLDTMTDPAGNVTNFGYDSLRRLNNVTNADATTREYTYDVLSRVATVTDENGKVSTLIYDANGNLTNTIDPLLQNTTFLYDEMDRLAGVVADDGSTATRTYDELGRVDTIVDRNGNLTTFTYDARGLISSEIDPDNHTWSRDYDSEGNLTTETDPLGNTRVFARNARQQIESLTLPRGGTISFAYDFMGNMTNTQDDSGRVYALAYDGQNMLEQITSGDSLTATHFRNGLGQRTTITDPNGQDWTAAYDTQARLKSMTDPLGNATTFTYTDRNRIDVVTFPGALGTLMYAYRPTGAIAGKVYSDSTNIAFGYDDAERLTTATGLALGYNSQDEITASNGIAMTRDDGGRLESSTFDTGKAITYGYDARGNVTSVSDWFGGVTTFAYDAAGRQTSVARPNGVVTTFSYNDDSQVTGIVDTNGDTTVSSITLFRDAMGFITGATRNVPEPISGAPSLIGETVNQASEVNGFTYDALGRLTSAGGRSFTWNLATQLAGFDEGPTSIDYTYDAFGALLTRAEGAETQGFVWNYALGLPSIAIRRVDAVDTTYYVHTPDGGLLYAIDVLGETRQFYHFDENGNTLFMTNDAGQVTNQYAYTPYGAVLASETPVANPFMFAGQIGHYTEADNGLCLMRARWYDPVLGRFLSRDPNNASNSPLETNPYSYARGNPFMFLDPTGSNARVNGSGAHTDLSVDVWEGDKIIGTFGMSFAAEAWGGGGSCVATGFQFILACTPIGAAGQMSGDFRLGKGVGSVSEPGKLIVPGTREQDERLGREFLKSIGEDTGLPTVAEELRRLMQKPPKGCTSSSKTLKILAESKYGRYRLMSQVCNDFTDDMLDIYFGYNWYTGPIWIGDTLVKEMKDHLKTLEDKRDSEQRARDAQRNPNGVAPIAGSTVVGAGR